ncbi:hypothetical protein KSF73_09900 [Burkholderiaceae bacterium DAT-1]|nr:hypothetical protein [Burkholderiaceae bacterium DAT-1]
MELGMLITPKTISLSDLTENFDEVAKDLPNDFDWRYVTVTRKDSNGQSNEYEVLRIAKCKRDDVLSQYYPVTWMSMKKKTAEKLRLVTYLGVSLIVKNRISTVQNVIIEPREGSIRVMERIVNEDGDEKLLHFIKNGLLFKTINQNRMSIDDLINQEAEKMQALLDTAQASLDKIRAVTKS